MPDPVLIGPSLVTNAGSIMGTMRHPHRPSDKLLSPACCVALAILAVALSAISAAGPTRAQDEADTPGSPAAVVGPPVPNQVEARPGVEDDVIAARLNDILDATGWFVQPVVAVQEGVVFLDGQTRRSEWQEWAEALAGNTEGVVAVVSRIEVKPGPVLDFDPALSEIRVLWRDGVGALPLIAVVAVVLVLTWLLALLTLWLSRRLLRDRMPSQMLTNLVAWLLAAPVGVIGIYVALRVAGLTQLALTVLGGTGVAGLIVGIAFRDIAENYLASILLSVRNPFRAGDIIEVAGYAGIVQRVTTRGTILMTFDGNHLQIPNSTVYKSTITNYTANPSRRMDFSVGIGYDAVIAEAQAALGKVLHDHPVVLDEPEPLVLVERLGASTVELRAYFWFNGTEYDGLKLKSALIRLSKRALEASGISMPDEAREVIFPQGVPLISRGDVSPVEVTGPEPRSRPSRHEADETAAGDPVSTGSEGGLRSEVAQIQQQARQARLPEAGEDLLETSERTGP